MKKNKLYILLTLLILILGIVEFFILKNSHAEHGFFLGFYIILGFLGSILIMFFAKALGKFFLHKKSSYYED